MKKRSGAQIVMEALLEKGVKTVFGYPGGAVIPIYDVLYDTKEIKHILTRHEQAAAHAADGYARATGKVGVCVATSGPGATNLVTGIATAYMDSIPIVVLTGQVPTSMIGNDAFQEANITGITYSITKHNFLVKEIDELPAILKEAFYIASTGRKGPVLVDLPRDVLTAETAAPFPEKVNIRSYNPNYKGNPKQIKRAAEAIDKSEKPVIYAGGGIISSGAVEELSRFAHQANIPVTTTLMGLGSFPEDDPLSLKMLGMHGTRYANYAISEADLIIAVGARFDDRITGKISEFAPYAKIIHIDIDPTAISKNVRVDIPMVGDAKDILSQLVLAIQKDIKRKAWHGKIEEWKRKHPLRYEKDRDLKPQFVVEKIYQITKGEAIIATEVGQNQMWAAQFYRYTRPRSFISSGGLGTMGYGFPASIGAQVGCPERVVFDIAGDGSFQMNIQELATVVNYQIPVKVAILNNGYLGMVRQWQQLFYHSRYSQVDLHSPDFVKIAKAYGAEGIRVEKSEEVEPALKKALATPGPVILDFKIAPEENVYPMVPAGAALTQMIEGLA